MSNYIKKVDIAVIGGGMAGLVAAVSAAKGSKSSVKIAVIEKEKRVGKKLLATGNGRCNLSNNVMSMDYYNGSCRSLAKKIISKYNPERVKRYMAGLGILCKADSFGRVYPNSEQASAVLDILRIHISHFGVEEICDFKVTDIKPKDDGFMIISDKEKIFASRVVLTTGGAASPKLGGCNSTVELAHFLKIRCTPLFPSLAPVPVKSDFLPYLKGIRTPVNATLFADSRVIRSEYGELQLTQNSLSGICMFQLSRFINEFFALGSIGGKKVKNLYISLDIMPDMSVDEIISLLNVRRKSLSYITLDEFFTGILNKKLGQCLFKQLGILHLNKTAGELTPKMIECLAELIKDWRFVPCSPSDINSAQVTCGGISSDEVDNNLQSVKYNGLYFAGEALDIDGLCGGYNLHWAIASGISVGSKICNNT